jgi:hypothetical protein
VNCSTCHVGQGGGNSRIELGLETPLGSMNLIDAPPVHSDLGLADARLVAPGHPERSVLLRRIARRGDAQMPPLVSSEVDGRAVELIERWIRGLPSVSR